MTRPADPPGHFPERRAETSALLALLQTVHDDVKKLQQNHVDLDHKLTQHMTEETMELAAEITKLMADAFPEGDPKGHRKHHEAVIAKAEARAAFWKKILEELSKYGLLGFFGWLVTLAWSGFIQGPHK